MNRKRLEMLVLLALIFTVIAMAHAEEPAVPAMPHVFYGAAYAGDQPVPAGTVIEARGAGITSGIRGNPVATIQGGLFGGTGMYDLKLVVQGSIQEGTPVEFYVAGVRAECFEAGSTAGWQQSYPFHPGGFTQLNLRITAMPAVTPTMPATAAPTTQTSSVTPTATTMPATTQATATPTSQYTYGYSMSGSGGSGSGTGVYMAPIDAATGMTTTIRATPSPSTAATQQPSPARTPGIPTTSEAGPVRTGDIQNTLPGTQETSQAFELFPSMNLVSMEAGSVLAVLAVVGILFVLRNDD